MGIKIEVEVDVNTYRTLGVVALERSIKRGSRIGTETIAAELLAQWSSAQSRDEVQAVIATERRVLDHEKAEKMRALHVNGFTVQQVSAKFNVPVRHVRKVLAGEIWK